MVPSAFIYWSSNFAVVWTLEYILPDASVFPSAVLLTEAKQLPISFDSLQYQQYNTLNVVFPPQSSLTLLILIALARNSPQMSNGEFYIIGGDFSLRAA